MGRIPLVRAGTLRSISSTLARTGQPPDDVFRRAGLRPDWIAGDTEALFPLLRYYRALEEASRDVPDFGARTGESPIRSVGEYGRIVLGSLTLYEALSRFCALGPVLGQLHTSWILEDPDRDAVWYCRAGHLLFEGGVAQTELAVLRYVIQLVREAAGEAWKPLALRFCGDREARYALTTIEAFQGVPAKTRQPWGGLCIPRRVAALRMPGGGGAECKSIERWSSSGPASGLPESLRQVLLSLLRMGDQTTLEAVSEIAGMHPRTLQRALADEATSFRRALAQARHLRARELLMHTDLPLSAIARDLGYSDLAHFSRAYRSWAGVSPSAHRPMLRSEPREEGLP